METRIVQVGKSKGVRIPKRILMKYGFGEMVMMMFEQQQSGMQMPMMPLLCQGGRLLDALKKSPYLENTIVVLWGDHGWHLGEKSHWRKMTLWERGTKTPFIIKLPGAKANGKRIEAPVSLQDIFPTLVDLCGLEVEQELDGNSLKSLLTKPSSTWDKAALMSHGPGNFAVRKGRWRLIHYADGSEELYDMKLDSAEFVNLANDIKHKDRCQELRKHLPKSWRYVMGPRFKKFSNSFAEGN